MLDQISQEQFNDARTYGAMLARYFFNNAGGDKLYSFEVFRDFVDGMTNYTTRDLRPLEKEMKKYKFYSYSFSPQSLESTLVRMRFLERIAHSDEWEGVDFINECYTTMVDPETGNRVESLDNFTQVYAQHKESKTIVCVTHSHSETEIKLSSPVDMSIDDMHDLIEGIFWEPNPYENKLLSLTESGLKIINMDKKEGLSEYDESVERNVAWLTSIADDKVCEKLESLNLPQRAGLVLAGPPGSGKTTLARRIATDLAGTVTVIYPDTNVSITNIVDAASGFEKSLVILEDVESFFGERGDSSLSAFLNAVDGLDNDDRIMFLATTNDSSDFDPAVRRAGRLERTSVIESIHPDALSNMVKSRMPEGDTDSIVSLLEDKYGIENITPAMVDSLARSIVMESIPYDQISDFIKLQWTPSFVGQSFIDS